MLHKITQCIRYYKDQMNNTSLYVQMEHKTVQSGQKPKCHEMYILLSFSYLVSKVYTALCRKSLSMNSNRNPFAAPDKTVVTNGMSV